MTIGFIGLGTMGLPMARNLVSGGHDVVGHDANQDLVDSFAGGAGRGAASARAAADGADFLITVLPNGRVVEDVLFGPAAVAEALRPGAIVIDMSTIHPLETDRIRAGLSELDVSMVDAPLGRTSADAITGTLLVMAGGAPDDLAKCEALFRCIGDTIVDCGGPGMGSRMKIVNNFMSTALNVLTAEALGLASKSGLDVGTAIEVMAGTTAGRGHMSTTYPAKVLAGDVSPTFMLDLAKKDLDIAISLAADLDTPLTMGAAAAKTYETAQAEGRGTQDWTAVFDMLRPDGN